MLHSNTFHLCILPQILCRSCDMHGQLWHRCRAAYLLGMPKSMAAKGRSSRHVRLRMCSIIWPELQIWQLYNVPLN